MHHATARAAARMNAIHTTNVLGCYRSGRRFGACLVGAFSEWQAWGFACFFFQAEDGIRDTSVTGVQTCASDLREPRQRPRDRRLADGEIGIVRPLALLPR